MISGLSIFSRGLIVQSLLFAIFMAVFSCTCQSVALAQNDDNVFSIFGVDETGNAQVTSSIDKDSNITQSNCNKRTWSQFFWSIVVIGLFIVVGPRWLLVIDIISGGLLNKVSGGLVYKIFSYLIHL